MLVKRHLRLSTEVYKEIEQMAVSKKITSGQVMRELIDIGLRVKKHMENKQQSGVEDAKLDNVHLEQGASAAIEALLLLRKIANSMNDNWAKIAHEEAVKRIEESE